MQKTGKSAKGIAIKRVKKLFSKEIVSNSVTLLTLLATICLNGSWYK